MEETYLASRNLKTTPSLEPDVVVVGSGVAGLSAALAAAGEGATVILLAKDELSATNTDRAQGGIAAAIGPGDSPEKHLQDTITVGAGLCDEDAVRVLVEEGAAGVRRLAEEAGLFDREDGKLAFTREGGHGERRVVHASGDATGRALEKHLLEQVEQQPNIRCMEHHFTIDLLHHEGRCYGVMCLDNLYGRMYTVEAPATILATGGLGRVFRETSNGREATGDGYAMSYRAGAVLEDMEFVQFHPTTLYLAGAPRFLISEAARGEGGYLLSGDEKRFMFDYHPDGELAPRDVVSGAIIRELEKTGASCVYLDLRHLPADLLATRFPSISRVCGDFGIDLKTDLVPVRPAVHYMMGGVKTDLEARTAVDGLYACGEVACTRVHGANRLASNSLLEGLVFGRRAGLDAASRRGDKRRFPLERIRRSLDLHDVPLDLQDVTNSLRSLTWRHLNVFRNEADLSVVERTVGAWERYVLRAGFGARAGFETQNMLTVVKAVARAARQRTESRGAHQRSDYPETDDDHWRRHSSVSRTDFE